MSWVTSVYEIGELGSWHDVFLPRFSFPSAFSRVWNEATVGALKFCVEVLIGTPAHHTQWSWRQNVRHFPPLPKFSTFSPCVRPVSHTLALEGQFGVKRSLNIHAVNFKSSKKTCNNNNNLKVFHRQRSTPYYRLTKLPDVQREIK
jgi:hypothetical protein